MPVHQKGDLQLGADPVGAGYQNRICIQFALKAEQTAKAPEIRQDLRTEGRADERLDAVDEFVSGVHIHAGFAIGGHGRGRILAEGLEGGQTAAARHSLLFWRQMDTDARIASEGDAPVLS